MPQLRSDPEVEARATVTAPFRAEGAAAASLVEKVMPGRRDGCGETALASCEDASVWIAAARAASTASDETRAVEAALATAAAEPSAAGRDGGRSALAMAAVEAAATLAGAAEATATDWLPWIV